MAKSKIEKKNKTKKADEDRVETIEEIYKNDIQPPFQLKANRGFGIKTLFLVLFFSLLGGITGGLIQESILSSYFEVLPQNFVEQQSAEKDQQVLDLNFLVQENDDAYNQVLTELKSQIVGFYKKRETSGILDSILLEKDFLGSGIIVTSDGWLLTHQSVIEGEDYIVVTPDKKILEPKQEVVDEFSGSVLVQVEADNLKPVRFATGNGLTPTSPLLTVRYSVQNHGSDIIKTAIQKFSYHDQSKGTDFLLTTEKIDHYLKTANQFEAVYNGSVLMNEENEVIGLLFYSGREMINLAIPSYYLKSVINNFLVNSQEIIRSSLGVYYVDLSESLGLSSTVTEGHVKGAVLLGDANQDILAIIPSSAAEDAGLTAGDIILSVNGEEIDERNSLTKLIQDYTPGQELTFTVIREGEEQEIKVVLTEL